MSRNEKASHLRSLPISERPIGYRSGFRPINSALWAVTCWVYGRPLISAALFATTCLAGAAFVVATAELRLIASAGVVLLFVLGGAFGCIGHYRNAVRTLRGELGYGW